MPNNGCAMRKTLAAAAVVLSLMLAAPAWAGFNEGFAAYKRGDYATALREWLPLAEQGDASAQYNLGVMYDEGRGVKQDYVQAMRWYRKAAAQGYASAQFNLGFMYAKSQDVKQDTGLEEGLAAYKRGDYATGLREWRPLAEQGDAQAHKWYNQRQNFY